MESFLLLSVSLSLLHIITAQQQQLDLGSNCQNGWVCTTPDKCTALGDLRISRPKICSFGSNNQPIMCCPPERSSHGPSKLDELCQGYVSQVCNTRTQLMKRQASENETGFDLELFVEQWSIVGGHLVRPKTHRHMALIGYGKSLDNVEWQCGGSVISNNFILSAAHCVENELKQIAEWVRVGDLDVSSNQDDARPENVKISQRIVHPGYKPPTLYNDIALFRLERNLFFNAWVGPACLSTQNVVPSSHGTVTGWGRIDFIGDVSAHLLAVDVALVASNECKKLLGTSSKIPAGINVDSMICAGEKEGGKDACSGDSGGPLVINNTASCLKTQIGVISFGRMCALPNSPGVYTRVYHFLPWIQSIVWP